MTGCSSDNSANTAGPSGSPGSAPTEAVTDAATPTASPGADEPSLTFTADEFPKIDGSTATLPLGQAVAAATLGISMDDAAQYAPFTGTDSAWRRLVDGDVDLLLVYDAAAGTRDYIDQSGVALETAPIGSDALVFLVNQQNPVNGLTSQQIRDIYSGKTTDWKYVGGTDSQIAAYQRTPNSGSQGLMVKLVMDGGALMTPPSDWIANTMEGRVSAVAAYDNGAPAIGYNVFYYVTAMKADPNIKILDIDGITPDKQTIQDKTYPFVNDFYVAMRADEPADSPARQLYNWLQTDEGKALIDMEGYVPPADNS